jgi:periplasmic protein TonB
MFIRTAAVLLALGAIASAQAPTPPPPKPKVIAMPKKAVVAKPKPKPRPKAAPKPQADAIETPELPAAEPGTNPPPATPENAAPRPPAPPAPEPPKRSRAAETSLAAYMPKVKAALGKGWVDSLKEKSSEFQAGNVSITFKLDATGKVTEVKTTENSSNAAFGKFCEEHVRGIQFDAPPPKALDEGTLEIPFTFWLY